MKIFDFWNFKPLQNALFRKSNHIFQIILASVTSLAATFVLIGSPNVPLFSIALIKTKTSSSKIKELPVKTKKLSGVLSVNACTEEFVSSVYDSQKNFQQAISGLKAFRVRLRNNYKSNSKNFSSLALQLLTEAKSFEENETCLIPLSVNADEKLGKYFDDSRISAIALDGDLIFCAGSKAYLSNQQKSPKYFAVGQSISQYSEQLKEKQIILDLKRQIERLKSNKRKLGPKKKIEIAKVDKEIRKISLSTAYADFFLKDGPLLGSLYDTLCKHVGAVTAVPIVPDVPLIEKPDPTPLATAVSTAGVVPTLAAPPTMTVMPTVSVVPINTVAPTPTSIRATPSPRPTALPTSTFTAVVVPQTAIPNSNARIAAPVINSIPNGNILTSNATQLNVSWSKVEYAVGQSRYLVRAVDVANPGLSILSSGSLPTGADNYRSENILLTNLQAGHSYHFWVHATKANYNYTDSNSWSLQDNLFFSVEGSSATATPLAVTATPIPTVTPSQTVAPTSAPLGNPVLSVGPAELLIDNWDPSTHSDLSSPTLRISATQFYTWTGNGDYSFEKWVGTLTNPYQTKLWSDNGRWNLSGTPSSPVNNIHHRPWMGNIYKHSDGTLIGFVHIETGVYDDSAHCRYRQGIAISTDTGDHWRYLGDVIKPQYDDFSNLGGLPLLIVGEYFYQYFNEIPNPVNGVRSPRIPTVARARITDVVAAAKQGTVAPWTKYNNGQWNQDGLTGVGSNILPYPDRYDMHTDAVYSTALRKYILVAWEQQGYQYTPPYPIVPANKGLYIYTSTDGINWENRIKAYTPNHIYYSQQQIDSYKASHNGALPPQEENPYSFFIGLESGTSDDFNVIGGNFYLNFPDRTFHKFYRIPINIVNR